MSRTPIRRPPYEVQVMHDADSGMWVGVCDVLGLATEEHSYEALIKRAYEIAPELADLNGMPVGDDGIHLKFRVEQETGSLLVM